MSNFMPVRPATDVWTAGRPMKREYRKVKTVALSHLGNPASDISLPLPGSIHSSLSSDSEFGSYKVSAFDSLAPRPTLRYAPGARWTSSRASVPAPTTSQKRPVERMPIPREMLRANKRIDDLADDLDASGLRELMERDDRMREKKRQNEQLKTERRLARRAEKQKEQANEARKSGTPPPENLERGVVGREMVGLGIDPASAVRTSSKHRQSDEPEPVSGATVSKRPSDSFHQEDAEPKDELSQDGLPLPPPPQDDLPLEPEEPVQELPQGAILAGLLRSKKSRSKSTLGSDKDKTISPPPSRIDEEEDDLRKGSVSSSKARFSLTSFLRRGGRSRRGSAGPSSFSNTSREEMQAVVASAQAKAQAQAQAESQHQEVQVAQAQALALAKLEGLDTSASSLTSKNNYLSRKPSAAAPKRTRSRFREDLPDFPLSPPDSRVQSPEAEPPLPALPELKYIETESHPVPIPGRRNDTPTSGLEGMHSTFMSGERGYGAPSPEPHQSMSLASIDSEGSWLSGRAASQRASTMRDSIARANRRHQTQSTDSPTNSTQEDLVIADDEYLSRLAPEQSAAVNPGGRRSGEGRPSSDEDDFVDEGDMKWGAVGAMPQVVHVRNDRQTMQSQEGLLNISSGDEDSDSPTSPASPISPSSPAAEEVDLRRARSVNLSRGHARNFSAGSAKLLDLTPRASVESRRASSGRRHSVPFN